MRVYNHITKESITKAFTKYMNKNKKPLTPEKSFEARLVEEIKNDPLKYKWNNWSGNWGKTDSEQSPKVSDEITEMKVEEAQNAYSYNDYLADREEDLKSNKGSDGLIAQIQSGTTASTAPNHWWVNNGDIRRSSTQGTFTVKTNGPIFPDKKNAEGESLVKQEGLDGLVQNAIQAAKEDVKDVLKRKGYDSSLDTLNHISVVELNLSNCAHHLLQRGHRHDQSKLEFPEKQAFDEAVPLEELTYGTLEYRDSCRQIKEALQHHYSVNDHHPQHFENGIYGMDLFQIMEMLCDWKASVSRGQGGDILKSLQINSERFGISKQLRQILLNTLNSGVI